MLRQDARVYEAMDIDQVDYSPNPYEGQQIWLSVRPLSGPPLSSLGEQISNQPRSHVSLGETLGYANKVSFLKEVQSACKEVNSLYGPCTSLTNTSEISFTRATIDQVNR